MTTHRYILIALLSLCTIQLAAQHKSFRFSTTAGANKYFGLKGSYNHPETEYSFGKALTIDAGFISGTRYLPSQYAFGFVVDYYSGTFREYGDGFNMVEYLNGEASKIMLGCYLVPYIFSLDEMVYIKPGIEWTYLISSDIEGTILSNEGQNFGEPIPLNEEFIDKSDIGVAVDVEYPIDFKRNWYFSPKFKAYVSLYDVLSEMKSLRGTLGFTIGYKMDDNLFKHTNRRRLK